MGHFRLLHTLFKRVFILRQAETDFSSRSREPNAHGDLVAFALQ